MSKHLSVFLSHDLMSPPEDLLFSTPPLLTVHSSLITVH